MKKGAIFDLDGTLVNSMKVWENADYILAERYGFKPDEEYRNRVTSCSFMQGAEYITERFKLRKTAEEIAQELYEICLLYTSCVDIRKNTSGEGGFLDWKLTLRHESVGSEQD